MLRSTSEIAEEAKVIGQHALNKSRTDNQIIQILTALVEELAENVQRQAVQIQLLKQLKS